MGRVGACGGFQLSPEEAAVQKSQDRLQTRAPGSTRKGIVGAWLFLDSLELMGASPVCAQCVRRGLEAMFQLGLKAG